MYMQNISQNILMTARGAIYLFPCDFRWSEYIHVVLLPYLFGKQVAYVYSILLWLGWNYYFGLYRSAYFL
jgi:hypothetical protein